MSVSSEVQRTLVKSPPELWAELSDPATLARHLGELGEIRITGTDPERLVDWEATGAEGAALSGRVEIEPSGWGTRVTLSVSREMVETRAKPDLEIVAESVLATSPPAPEPAPEPAMVEVEVTQAPEPTVENKPEPILEPELHQAEPEPRASFLVRLFRRRKCRPELIASELAMSELATSESEAPMPEPGAGAGEAGAGQPMSASIEIETEAEQTEPEPVATAVEEVTFDDTAAQAKTEPESSTTASDIAAELAELEQQTTAVLTGVLDCLGAAHHRPFSRA